MMNELRMYVERLFEGKVLTSEMIELKEEIYGNLVARYEDYIAEGMDEAEALEKTKASITSVEDVLEEAADAAETAVSQATLADAACETAAAGQPAEPAPAGAGAADSAATGAVPTAVPNTAPGAGADAAASSATSAPSYDGNWLPVDQKPRKRWPIVVGAVAVLLIACVAVVAGLNVFAGGASQAAPGQGATSVQTQNGQGATGAGDAATGNQSAQGDDRAHHFEDPEDQREYEMTSALATQIENISASQIASASGSGSTQAQFFESLAMGDYVASTGREEGSSESFNVGYQEVPDAIDGDMIDRALLLNATAAFCAYPELQTVNLTVREQYDTAYDADVYSFSRSTLEQAYSRATDGAVTGLGAAQIASDDAWGELRSIFVREDFCDRQIDIAEID